jgi:hypothetical protein
LIHGLLLGFKAKPALALLVGADAVIADVFSPFHEQLKSKTPINSTFQIIKKEGVGETMPNVGDGEGLTAHCGHPLIPPLFIDPASSRLGPLGYCRSMSNAVIRPLQPETPIFFAARTNKRDDRVEKGQPVSGLSQLEADYVVDSGLSLPDMRSTSIN